MSGNVGKVGGFCHESDEGDRIALLPGKGQLSRKTSLINVTHSHRRDLGAPVLGLSSAKTEAARNTGNRQWEMEGTGGGGTATR
ncbi:Hypothetical protein NTJ_08742 [Nesidiocoris tenuis]|uniref:Uncharacterized protein n=1 Tax=Nesidiocoris tenuis TaxID=355587 RepID=A0ABN7AVG3_9HEMI|nr:Hypothetical protein NTJ_08742 [Nesidiocoris tenuis]